MPATRTTPTDPTVPPNAVHLVPAQPDAAPLRMPADAWALVITTVGLHPVHTDTADVLAGVWLPAEPPARLHRGDVAVRMTPPDDADPARADIEVLTATPTGWTTVQTLPARDTGWPHDVAVTAMTWMRASSDESDGAVRLRAFTTPLGIGRAPTGFLPSGLGDAALLHPEAPDALAALIDAGLVAVGDQLVWNGHIATVCQGGALVRGSQPHELFNTAVSSLATSLATPVTVNGWYLWRRARDNRPLAELRAQLATR